MSEQYVGTKFKTIFLKKQAPEHKDVLGLISWSKKFAQMGLSPSYGKGSSGNLSFRTENGFIITGAYTNLGSIGEKELVEVISCDKKKKEVKCIGLREPSSETFLHNEIYNKRKDVNAIFHGHSDDIPNSFPITEKHQPYGSLALVDEVMKIINNHALILFVDHGFLSIGKTMDEAGKRIISLLSP